MDTPLSQLHRSLTPAQLAAVTHVQGPLLILAGPGSGKTRVVTHRIAHLLNVGIPARQILALTFTNKAAAEMQSRLASLAPGQPVWMGTFHRFCARTLRMNAALVGLAENYSIYDMDDSRKMLVSVLEEEGIDLSHTSPDAVHHAISWAKNHLITAEKYVPARGLQIGRIVERVYPKYQRALLRANAVDFDDLLLHVATMLRENPEVRADLDKRYQYIMVDEYQDTNLAQYAIVRALSINYPNLAVTGDPDQSIYGWRGANLDNILDFEKDFPDVKVVRLEQNYRSSKAILRVADQLIEHNIKRKQKGLYTDNPEGEKVRLFAYPTQRDEAEHIASQIAQEIHAGRRRARDFAIFYRTNALSRQIEHSLREHVIPYQIVNGLEFYQRKEIKDVLAYLHLLNNPRSDVALLRIINTPTRGIGKSSIQKIQAHARNKQIPLLDAAREAGLIRELNKKSALSIAKFVAMYDRLGEAVLAPLEEIVGKVLSETGYREVLQNSEAEEDQERLANLEELLTAAREFDIRNPGQGNLEQFLEESSLVADTDAWEAETDKVTMMTLHAAKGLEFPCVFIVACEQGLLPHERSIKDHDRDKLEEERRLMFVGITRAMERLQLSYAQYRTFRGMSAPTVPSMFLMELPRHEMDQSSNLAGLQATADWDEPAGDTDFDFGANEDDGSQLPAHDDEFTQLDEPRPKKEREKTLTSGLLTAADLLARQDSPGHKTPINAYKHGMTVSHPEHGLGTITSLAGEGPKRTATVQFFADSQERKFRLMFANLEPVEE